MKSRNYNIKQIAENQSVLQIYLYGEIEPSYLNIWGDLVESKTSAEYIRKAIEKAGEIEGIELYINSIGGYIDEGVSIYNLLKRQSVPVTAYIDGMACSIASVVAMAADKIVMPSNTTMMIHHAVGGCYGNAKEHREFATQLDKISEASTNSYLVHAGDKLKRHFHCLIWIFADKKCRFESAHKCVGGKINLIFTVAVSCGKCAYTHNLCVKAL